jgi:hypothetical protein
MLNLRTCRRNPGRIAILLAAFFVLTGALAGTRAHAQAEPSSPQPSPDNSQQNASQRDQTPPDQTSEGQTPQAQSSQNPPAQNPPPNNPAPQSPPEGKPQNQNPPGGKKDESGTPAESVEEATRKFGEETLTRVRDWEKGWFTGPYVSRSRVPVTLTAEQRRDIYLQQTLTTPSDYFKRMLAAGVDQIRDSPSQWNTHWSGYGERFASREGQFITSNSLAALGNAALKYEPRYDQCHCRGFWPRTRHAIMRNFLTYDQSEEHLRPQWALYGGAFAGGVIATSWKPHPRNALANGGVAVMEQSGEGAALNFFIEFAGEINRKLWARTQGARTQK